jgi:hypothetical protein
VRGSDVRWRRDWNESIDGRLLDWIAAALR